MALSLTENSLPWLSAPRLIPGDALLLLIVTEILIIQVLIIKVTF